MLVDVNLSIEVFSFVLEYLFEMLDVLNVSILYLEGLFFGNFAFLFKLKLEHLNILDVFCHGILFLGKFLELV